MSTSNKVFLGYEVDTGKPIYIKLHHLIVTGQTRLSGKTTCLEALVHRSGRTALTFLTKRGEIGFTDAQKLPIFFDEKGLTNWKTLEGLIESTIEEKIRREPGVRPQLIKLCRESNSIYDIYETVKDRAENPDKHKIRSMFVRDVLTKLYAYLDLVVPELKKIRYTNHLELHQGVNLMDLSGLKQELQLLIIQSCLNHVYSKSSDTITVVPEAWKVIPQDRGSPTKPVIENLIREGATVGNYVWFDSQDLRGVDKKYLRQIDNWILGRQREIHEVENTLNQLPLPRSLKPKPEDIMTLKLGHFIAALHDDVYQVYVQPIWLPTEIAVRVAKGEIAPDSEQVQKYKPRIISLDTNHIRETVDDLRTTLDTNIQSFQTQLEALKNEVAQLHGKLAEIEKKLTMPTTTSTSISKTEIAKLIEDRINALASQDLPVAVTLRRKLTEFNLETTKEVLTVDEQSWKGKVLKLGVDGFLNTARKSGEIMKELVRRYAVSDSGGTRTTLNQALEELCAKGILEREESPSGWLYKVSPEFAERVKTS